MEAKAEKHSSMKYKLSCYNTFPFVEYLQIICIDCLISQSSLPNCFSKPRDTSAELERSDRHLKHHDCM